MTEDTRTFATVVSTSSPRLESKFHCVVGDFCGSLHNCSKIYSCSAIFFSYIDPETKLMDTGFTEHSGCPVFEGEKKIVTQWIRLGVDDENPWDSFNTLGIKLKDIEELERSAAGDVEDDGEEDAEDDSHDEL